MSTLKEMDPLLPSQWSITQTFSGDMKISQSYFMYGGIFLHFWGIVEFLVNRIKIERDNLPEIDRRQYYRNMAKKLGEIIELQITDWEDLYRFRNTMAHFNVNFTVSRGAHQQKIGWIKPFKNEAESIIYNDAMKSQGISEPEMSIFDTYSEDEIKALITKAIDLIKKIQTLTTTAAQFDIEKDKTYLSLKRQNTI